MYGFHDCRSWIDYLLFKKNPKKFDVKKREIVKLSCEKFLWLFLYLIIASLYKTTLAILHNILVKVNKLNYRGEIDGLRAIPILSVVFFI